MLPPPKIFTIPSETPCIIYINKFGSFPVVPSCVPLDIASNVVRTQGNITRVKPSLEENPSLKEIQTRSIARIKQTPTCENNPSAKI